MTLSIESPFFRLIYFSVLYVLFLQTSLKTLFFFFTENTSLSYLPDWLPLFKCITLPCFLTLDNSMNLMISEFYR